MSILDSKALDPAWRSAALTTFRAEQMRQSFRTFAEKAWPVVEPARAFIPNWHIDAVCEHLQGVAEKKIRRLVINIPPGHAKSLLAAVLWPAWVWTWNPAWRVLCCSYAEALATRDSVKCRQLIQSDWYQKHFCRDPWKTHKDAPPNWALSGDQNVKSFFSNSESGFRISLGVGGQGTGFRGDAVLVDDPLNATDAASKALREACVFWWDVQMSSRVNDLSRDSFVVMGQRLHQEDLAGHCIELGYELLCLPSEFDPARKAVTSLGTADRRTEPDELLFPQLFPKEVLEEAKKTLGSEGYSGQHAQQPSPPGGGLFKRKDWRFWRWADETPATVERPKGCCDIPTRQLHKNGFRWDSCLASVDATFKSAEQSKTGHPDWVVLTVWGSLKADRFLLYMWRKQAGLLETCSAIREMRKLFPRAYRVLVEDKANGPAIIETLRHEISGLEAVSPEGGKEARANAVAPQVESGNVYLPEGAPWLDLFVSELGSFPRGRHDDVCDSTSQALLWMHLGVATNATRAIATARAVG